MALGDPYATRDEIKSYLKISLSDTQDDSLIDDALASVTTEIEDVCERQFNSTNTASARVYVPVTECMAIVDDFYTTTGFVLATDSTGDGVFETSWTVADLDLYPLNGVVNGQTGWPYWVLKPKRSSALRFPCGGFPSLQLTVKWGWTAVPRPVHEACKIATAETFALKDARFGVAGFGAMGDLRVRDNPMVMKKLSRYILNPVKVA